MLNLDDIISFPVVFIPGMHGTWLTWFINEHDEFVKLERLNTNILNNQTIDYSIDSGWWHNYNTLEDFFGIESKFHRCKSWKEHLDQEYNLGHYTNTRATKAAVKLFPHHSMDGQAHVAKDLFNECKAAKVIIPFIGDTLREEMEARWVILLSERDRNHTLSSIHVDETFNWLDDIIDTYYVDIGKLIMKHEEEYQNLITNLGISPLNNWQDKCNRVLREIYNVEI
jgi:hypothetical protein